MKTVLVVEDNADNARLITYALQRAGYGVLSAGTAEEGAALAIREQPFFVIMDIDLPGPDGFEAIRRIRASPGGQEIPVIAITSLAMRGDRETALRAGCVAYFEKPIDPLVIVDRIHEALGIRASEASVR